MATKIYTDRQDEQVIETVLKKGLKASLPKWNVLRLALGRSSAHRIRAGRVT
jgi:hypothetical protein